MATPAARIDVHFHLLPQFCLDAWTGVGLYRSKGTAYPEWSEELSLKVMDDNGIATAITSFTAPHMHFGDDSKARALSRRCNDFSVDLVRRRPDRFGNLAVLPLPDIDGACKEAAYALDELKLDGIIVLASYGEVFLGDPMFDPLFGELDRRSAVVLIHPTQHPPSKLLPLDLPLFVAEYPINTTRAALNLMTKGVLQRFPNIRFVLSHAGGVLPYLTWRLANPWVPPVFESDPKTMLRRFWYDIALSAGRQTLGCLKEVADPDKILFGTDWPYTTEESVRLTVKDFTQSGMFTPAQTADIERGNSLKLFPRLAR